MQYLKQSTEVDVRIGPAMAYDDGVTAVTDLTLGGADQAELLKNNGAATVDISGATFAAVTNCDGWYDLTLTTSHTDTIGQVTVVIQDADKVVPIFVTFHVLAANVFDSLFGAATDKLQTDVTQMLGTTLAETSGGNIAANFDEFFDNDDALTTKVVDDVGGGSGGDATAANQTTILNRLGSITGTGDNTILGFFKALLSKAAGTPSDIGGTFDPAADSTEAISEAIPAAAPTADAVADAVWDEAIADHTTSTSFGAKNQTDAGAAVLDSTGLDNISATEPTGLATTFVGKLMQVWARLFNKVEQTSTT